MTRAAEARANFTAPWACGGLALGGCSTSIDGASDWDGLANTTWWVQTIEGEAIDADAASRVIIDENGYIVASAGCARFTGKTAMNGNPLAVTKIGLVEETCANSDPLHEAQLIETFERVDRWAVQESYMLLCSEGSAIPTRLARHL